MAQLDGCSDIYLHNNGFLLCTTPPPSSGLLPSVRPLWGLGGLVSSKKCALRYLAKAHLSNPRCNYFWGKK